MKQTWRRFRAWLGRPKMTMQDRIVLVDETNRCTDPIFLIGLHRSGTSLMRRVMNAHPDIACPPESFFMEHYTRMLTDDAVAAGYRGFGNDPEMMRTDLARKASDLHEGFRIARGKRRWADKTPSYTAILPELRALFPGARFIVLYRHPFDVADSIRRRGWNLAGPGSESFEGILTHMETQYALQMAFEKANPDLCFRIRYEDLMAAPEASIHALMTWLGERYDPVQLDHHKAQHNFGTEDPIVRGTKGFVPSIANWHAWSGADLEQATEALAQICKELGYNTASGAENTVVGS